MKESTYINLVNEGADGYTPSDPREEALDKELQALKAVWTVEVTTTRRAAWNAEMIAVKKVGKKVVIHQVEERLGFRFSDLKAAIVRHKL